MAYMVRAAYSINEQLSSAQAWLTFMMTPTNLPRLYDIFILANRLANPFDFHRLYQMRA